MLDAIRSGDRHQLSKFDDLAPIRASLLFSRYEAQLDASAQKLTRAAQQGDSVESQIATALSHASLLALPQDEAGTSVEVPGVSHAVLEAAKRSEELLREDRSVFNQSDSLKNYRAAVARAGFFFPSGRLQGERFRLAFENYFGADF
jgi:hypothetical protein